MLVRNPYYPAQVTHYRLAPDVIDAIVFCTKNPAPMFQDFALLDSFDTFWFVTITPYGKDIEPYVPDKEQVVDSFRQLSDLTGPTRTSWRYDPIFISEKYTVDYHIAQFARMAERLRGSTRHDKKSPFLIGGFQEGDIIKDATQVSWRDPQMNLFDLMY